MFMNSVLNSDSEKCTESKLSRVHSASTLGPACAHITRALRRVATHARPCRSAHPAMSQRTPSHVAAHARPYRGRVTARTRTPCRRATTFKPGHDTIFVSRLESLAACTTRRVARAQRRIVAHPAPYRSLYRCPYCDTNATPSHETNFCIATLTSNGKALARASRSIATLTPRAGWSYRRPPGRVVACIVALPRRVVGVAWPYHGHALAVPRPISLALCHDTIH